MADDEDEVPEKAPPSIPGWVVTFSDLMSLLLAFFVLLFSFSEMDRAKFKVIGGSMKEAFGVQNELKVTDPLKGLEIIAREFSPGRPDPTTLNEIRQETTSTYMRYLLARNNDDQAKSVDMKLTLDSVEILRAALEKLENSDEDGESQEDQEGGLEGKGKSVGEKLLEALEEVLADKEEARGGEANENAREFVGKVRALVEAEVFELENKDKEEEENAELEKVLAEARSEIAVEGLSKGEGEDNSESSDGNDGEKAIELPESEPDEIVKVNPELTEAIGPWIEKTLQEEIESGMIDVLMTDKGKKIVIRIKETGSFASGSAKLLPGFDPVIAKMQDILQRAGGQIVVAGHTDDRPINSYRFRSNWELSASRAVSLVHELLSAKTLQANRFEVQGHSDTRPLADNKTSEGRSKNRRVEVILERQSKIARALSVENPEKLKRKRNKVRIGKNKIDFIKEKANFTEEESRLKRTGEAAEAIAEEPVGLVPYGPLAKPKTDLTTEHEASIDNIENLKLPEEGAPTQGPQYPIFKPIDPSDLF